MIFHSHKHLFAQELNTHSWHATFAHPSPSAKSQLLAEHGIGGMFASSNIVMRVSGGITVMKSGKHWERTSKTPELGYEFPTQLFNLNKASSA